MENASKALLIAAAVLIVVLLVAFGMRIFSQSSSSVDVSGTASEMEVAQFNAQFKAYEGTISPSVLTKLIDVINSSNNREIKNNANMLVNARLVYMKNIGETDGEIITPSPGYAAKYDNTAQPINYATWRNPSVGKGVDFSKHKSFNVSIGYNQGRIVAIYVKGIE